MKLLFTAALVSTAMLATPATAGDWSKEIDVDLFTEFHTLTTDAATCTIGWNGDSLYVAVGSKSKAIHRGWFMQNGRTPYGVAETVGNPLRAFHLTGCADQVKEIESVVVRCQWMYLSVGPARVQPVHYENFGCPITI